MKKMSKENSITLSKVCKNINKISNERNRMYGDKHFQVKDNAIENTKELMFGNITLISINKTKMVFNNEEFNIKALRNLVDHKIANLPYEERKLVINKKRIEYKIDIWYYVKKDFTIQHKAKNIKINYPMGSKITIEQLLEENIKDALQGYFDDFVELKTK